MKGRIRSLESEGGIQMHMVITFDIIERLHVGFEVSDLALEF